MTQTEIDFLKNPENAFACDACPENRHDDEYRADGRLPCGQWQCWVVLKTETWRNRGKK